MSQHLTIDHSRRSTANACLRKYYYRYIQHLVPAMGSNALRYGSTWHGFMDGYYNYIMSHGWSQKDNAMQAAFAEGKRVWEHESSLQSFYEDDYRTFENCTKAFLEYINYFAGDAGMLEVLDVEKTFKIDFPDFTFTGKLDLQVELNGTPWLMEHKTTGQAITQQVDRLNRSAQTIGYALACRLAGIQVEGILISFHQLACRKTKSGGWGSLTMNFQRTPQLYTAQNYSEWYTMFLHDVRRIQEALETQNWVKNYDSCYQYGRCSYLDLCDQYRPLGEEVTTRYTTKEWNVLNTVEREPITCQAQRI